MPLVVDKHVDSNVDSPGFCAIYFFMLVLAESLIFLKYLRI